MATRLYPNVGNPSVSLAFDSGWEVTSGAVRSLAVLGSANYSSDSTNFPNTAGSGSANDDVLASQLVYGPIAAQTITGTFKGQILAREANAAADARAQIVVRVVSPTGTVRGTLIAMDTAALANEFTVDTAIRTNRKFPRGGAQSCTSTAATAGDYIVIEYGHRNHGTNTGVITVRGCVTANVTTDAPEDETTTVANDNGIYRDWFEFSQTISPYTAPTPSATSVTFTARAPGNTNQVNAGNAAVTVTANQPTISFVPPARSVTINSSDFTSVINLDSFSITECANRGEVGTGGFDVFDAASALDVPALKAVQFDEPAAGTSNKRIFTGFTDTRTTSPLRSGSARSWAVNVVDLNVLASDFIITDAESGSRGAETDYARVLWLITSTAFGTVAGVGNGNVVNANTVTMEATDYRGRYASDVLAECSEASSKLWFVYDYGAGRKLYYDTATANAVTSTAKISDTAGDPDGSTVFAAQNVSVQKSPGRIYSKIHYTYQKGTITATNATTASNYRQREVAVLDSTITDTTLATTKANALLAGAAAELVDVNGLEIVVSAAHVNDIRAGQRVQIKLSLHGVSSYTYFRVIRRTVVPLNGGDPTTATLYYSISFGLASDVLASANGSRGRDDIPQNLSNANDDGATVRVDRGGITITDGGITVTNAGAVVIIDGTSDMFKILTTGTHSVAPGAGHATASDTVTLTGLGTFSTTPAHVTYLATGNSYNAHQHLGFLAAAYGDKWVAGSSGGTANQIRFMFEDYADAFTALNGSSQCVHQVDGWNESTGVTYYSRYYILAETAL